MVAAAAAGTVASFASAAPPGAPAPGCAGASLTDPRGDAIPDARGSRTPPPAANDPNLDVVEAFFTTAADGVVTANVRLAELERNPDAEASTLAAYDVAWTVEGSARTYSVSAATGEGDGAAPDFSWRVDDNGATVASGATTGAFAEGADGVLSIVIPPAARPGPVLRGPVVTTTDGFTSTVDRAPDQGVGTDYPARPCPGPGDGSPAPGGAAPGGGGGSSSPRPSPGPGSGPIPKGPAGASRLRLRFNRPGGPARRFGRARRTIPLPVRSLRGETVRGVRVLLFRLSGPRDAHRTQVGSTGRRVTVRGRKALVVRVPRGLTRGRYLLVLTGTDRGRQGRATARVRFT